MRSARGIFLPLAIALPAGATVVEAARRATLTPFGRDQGIFQYIAWAIENGARAYRDVRDVNGPLTYLVHLAFLKLGGADEHRFRVLDAIVSTVAFVAVGALIAELASRRPRVLERAAWAGAACVVLGAAYLAFNYWDVVQRESFFDWLVFPGLALVATRREKLAMISAGALLGAAVFGKPTYALFPLIALAAIGFDRRMLIPFAIGGAGAAAVMLGLTAAIGDLASYARITFVDVPAMYRFIWPRTAADILTEDWYGARVVAASALALIMIVLIVRREMPRRMLAIAIAPIAGVVSVVAQAKSFPYHWHPVVGGIGLQVLALVAWSSRRFGLAPRARIGARLVPALLASALALCTAAAAADSPFTRAEWLATGARTPSARSTREYFEHFGEPDYFPFDLREAAAYLREHTEPRDRVQLYGMDPYALFLAARRSATPYIYVYDLDVDAAAGGGAGARPNAAQRARIEDIGRAHAADLAARIEREPPAAFLFLDKAPLMSDEDAFADFVAHCPEAASFVRARYGEAARFGSAHVWLRER